MFFLEPLSLCSTFIGQLNESLKSIGSRPLSRSQRMWLSICITGVLVTNTVCWKRFERACFGRYSSAALSKMFCRGKILWEKLLFASVCRVIAAYTINCGVLALDGTENKRSKNTKAIAKVHKMKDKSTGGFVMGQHLTILVLITDKVTVPVGFELYEPDPAQKQWQEQDKQLRKTGVPKYKRPKALKRNPSYPTITDVALRVLQQFKINFPHVKIKAILADAYYGSKHFVHKATILFPDTQFISQVKKSQKVKFHRRYISVEEYFKIYTAVERKIPVRGKEQTVLIHGARLYLKAHGCKRFIVAMKYEDETEYRYLIATDLTWRLTDIAAAYTLRWLVEVFIQDWKSYEGWCQLAKQPGDTGTRRGVVLSLLTDHCLLLHEDQMALIKNKLPAATVGSLRDRERANAMVEAVGSLVQDKADANRIANQLKDSIENIIPLRPSNKHMAHKDMPNLTGTASLAYRAAV
jgi:hypothetical protein